MKPKRKKIPNAARAIINGKIATIYHGRRVINFYTSGQTLIGRIADKREQML